MLNKNTEQTKNLIIQNVKSILDDAKMLNIMAYKGDLNYFVDFVVIATGTSDRHIDGATLKIAKALKHDHSLSIKKDNRTKDWVILDVGFAMIHLMTDEIRSRYNLEELMSKNLNRPFE